MAYFMLLDVIDWENPEHDRLMKEYGKVIKKSTFMKQLDQHD